VNKRKRIEEFETEFAKLHQRALDLLDRFPEDRLFAPSGSSSFGHEIIRSAAEVEKTSGGITTRLWDDPFEWTLPEELSDKRAITRYIEEVRATRTKGISFIRSDDELSLTIPAPEIFRSLSEILTHAITLSGSHLDRAYLISTAVTPA
jgi:hypothetical protein